MNARTRAAAIWGQLEKELIDAGLDPAKFLVPRARMIRALGDALKGKRRLCDLEPEPVAPLPTPPLLPLVVATLPAREALRREQLVEVIDKRLQDLLERSCGVRGYSGDDTAEYK